MELDATILKICDNCRKPLKAGDPDRDLRISAVLADEKGKNKNFHMCNEGCLLAFLQKRAKKKQSSRAGFDFDFRVKPRKSI